MNTWVQITAIAAGTYLLRAAALLWIGDADRLPAWLRGWLDYVPPAVLAALVAPYILLPSGGAPGRAETVAYAVCLGVALWSRRLIPPLLAAGLTLALVRGVWP